MDATLVYAAKHANFDCGCMIDRQLLTMRRGLPELRDALDPVVHARLLADLADVIEDSDSADAAATVAGLHRYFEVAAL